MAHASRSAFQLTALALALASMGAQADTITWATPNSGGNWTLPTSWTPLGPPVNSSDVVITLNGTQTVTHDVGNDTISTLNFNGAAPNPNAILLVTALAGVPSSLAINNGGTNSSQIRADNGTVSFNGGTLVNNGTLNAINNGVVGISNATVSGGTLTTASGGTIMLNNGAVLDGLTNGPITNTGAIVETDNSTAYGLGTIHNNGTIAIGTSGNNTTDFRLQGTNNLTLDGTGTTTLINGRIYGDNGNDALTIGASQTVQGYGNVGINRLVVTNNGTISANVSAQTLTLDPTDGQGNFVNNGTLQATGGGTLQFFQGTYTNNHLITAANNSAVVITNSAVVQGGTVSTTGSGSVTLYNSATLDGLNNGAITLTGNVVAGDNQVVYGLGTINDNTLTLGTSGNNTTDLRIQGTNNLTLANNGTTTLINARIFGDNGNDVLTNTAGNTIQGYGNVGANQAFVTNAGVITANVNGSTLTLDPSDGTLMAPGLTNTGTLRAENGGTLLLGTAFYDNSAGTIQAKAGSTVSMINSANIIGGTVSTQGTGQVNVYNGVVLDGSTKGTITLTGNVNVGDDQTAYGLGTINDNTLTVGTTGANTTDFRIQGTNVLTLANNGTTTLINGRIFGDNGNDVLTNTAGNTIQGYGNVGANQAFVTNAGVITANVSGMNLTIDPSDGTLQAPGLINTGTIRAENGGGLTLTTAFYDNSAGLIQAKTGSTVSIINSANIIGGTVSTQGTGQVNLYNGVVLDGSTKGAISLTGNVSVGDNQYIYGLGTINDNTLTIGTSGNNTTDLHIQGSNNLTLANNGTTTLINARIYGDNGADVLTNTSGNTIQGYGSIGINQTMVNNAGLITSNVNGQNLTIDPSDGTLQAAGLVNTGTIRAENGGGLTLTTGIYDNSAGTIQAMTGSTIAIINSANILGGTVSTQGTGQVNLYNGVVLDGSTKGAITLAGNVAVSDNQYIYGLGTINDNALSIGTSGNNTTDLHIQGTNNLTLANGTTTLINGRIYGDNGNDLLTNAAGNTIQGYGFIGINQTQLTNAGTINANVSGNGINLNTSSAVVNQSTGILQASNNGTLYIDKAVTGTGTIRTDSGGTVTLNQGAQTGQLINNANLSIGTNNVTVSADYNNANFGTGNNFNKHANITGTGQVLASGDVAQAITGANVTNGTTGSPTLTIGNVRVGGTTYNYQVANTGTNGPSIRGALETSVNGGNITDSRLSGSGVTASNYGPVATGSNSGNLGVTFTVNQAGLLAPLSNQAVHVANNFDNVSEQTLGIALASGAAAYNVAVGSATPTPITFGNVRVGGTDSQALAIHNGAAAGAYSEDLNASFGTSTGSAQASGSVTGVLAGATNTGALTAGLKTNVAGAITGAVTVNYATAGTVNGVSNGLGTMSVGGQTINLSGNVYNMAVGSTTPTPVVIANQRVGGTNSQALTVANTAAAGNYSEALNASFGGTTGTATSNGGSVSNIAAGTNVGGALAVGVNTTSSGAKSGSVTVSYQSDGTGSNGHSGLSAIGAGSQSIAVTGNVYQLAAGTITTAPYNFGVLQVGQTVTQNISVMNSATGAAGYVEDLNASFGAATGTGAGNVFGTGSVSGLLAGATNSNGLTVGVHGTNAGTVNASIAVNYVSAGAVNGVSNGLGTMAVGSSNYGVSGTIVQGTATVVDQAAPVINNSPIALGNVRINSASPTGLVSVTNVATGNQQAALNASISGSAPVTASGSFNGLAPGATNNSSLAVGIDTSSGGAKNGTATIAFVSDASNQGCTSNCQMQLASQSVSVTGAVYRLASPTIDPTVATQGITVAGRVGTTAQTTAIGISNSSTDGYTEGLTATRIGTSAGFTSSGSITNLVAGGSSNAIGVTLNTATAGTYTGTQAIAFASTGAGTDNAATDVSLGSSNITLNGKVYTPAVATLNTQSVNFGVVHVGDTVAQQNVSVSNSAATTALNDTLVAQAAGASGPFSNSGSLGAAGLASGQTSDSALKVGLSTMTAGAYTGTATFSAASHDADLSDAALANLAVSLTGTVNNYASDRFTFGNGAGTLTQVGSTFTLDYGTVAQNSGTEQTTLFATNDATGPADDLNGAFTFQDHDFNESFADFMGLMAGSDSGPLTLSFDTSSIGQFMDTITLHGVGTNASGYSGMIGDITLIVQGTVAGAVMPPPGGGTVPEPDSLLLLGLGLPLLFIRRRKAAQTLH